MPTPHEPAPAAPGLSLPSAVPDLPLPDLDRAHLALNTPARSAPGIVGKVVDRLMAGRDQRSAEATTAVGDAVTDLARRLADAEADLSRRLSDAETELSQRLDAIDDARRVEAVDLARRLSAVASDLTSIRDDLDGALEQDRITAGILADAERRLADEAGDLRLRVDKLTAETATEKDPP